MERTLPFQSLCVGKVMIKYKYIVQLIQAHFVGDEVRFLDRAEKVAKELEREGGRLQAQAILREVDLALTEIEICVQKEI